MTALGTTYVHIHITNAPKIHIQVHIDCVGPAPNVLNVRFLINNTIVNIIRTDRLHWFYLIQSVSPTYSTKPAL